jgi:hypothetical protein
MQSVIVRAYVRRLPTGARASDAARHAARLAGLVLPSGHTFVGPFVRSVSDGLRLVRMGKGTLPTVGKSETVIPKSGTWVEIRYLVRWRDDDGKKHSKFLKARIGKQTRNR